MAEERVSIVEAREQIGRLVDAAYFSKTATVITKNGEPRAILMPYAAEGQSGADAGADLHVSTLNETPRSPAGNSAPPGRTLHKTPTD